MQLAGAESVPTYERVATMLRTAIAAGELPPGSKLPSGPELAKQFGIARMTVQKGIDQLKSEGLVTSRPGSGVFVQDPKSHPGVLEAAFAEAFDAPDVTIDYAGWTPGELTEVLSAQAHRIEFGPKPLRSIAIRLLLPDPIQSSLRPPDTPEPLIDLGNEQDRDSRRLEGILSDLDKAGQLIRRYGFERMGHSQRPMFTLIVLNGVIALFRFELAADAPAAGDTGARAAFTRIDLTKRTAGQAAFAVEAQHWFEHLWTTEAYQP